MCTRYYLEKTLEMEALIREMNRSALAEKWRAVSEIRIEGEIFPTNVVPVICSNKAGKRAVFPMKWGFTGKTLLLNARTETAHEKPTFKEAWGSHRCIVPASWYYEWGHGTGQKSRSKTGDKYLIKPEGGGMTWLCGLYRIEDGLPHFVILTREADDSIRFIHERMPLIMPYEKVDEWIRPDSRPEELINEAQKEMLFEKLKQNTE